MEDLTKNQQFFLVALYKEYISRQSTLDPVSANYFVDSDSLIPLLGVDFSSEYVGDICLALLDKGYISGYKDEDSVSELGLSDKTIIYMENRFKNNLKSILDFVAKFKPF